jgi:hypothetical protein
MADAPALGFSVIANLGDNRQLTCQCFVDVDAPLSDINGRIDKVQAVINRQQAVYKIKDFQLEHEKHRKAYTRLQDDLAAAELRYEQDRTAENVRLIEIGQELATGEVIKASVRNAREMEKKQIVAKRDAATAERAQYIGDVLTSKERFEGELEALTAKITECEALIAAGKG